MNHRRAFLAATGIVALAATACGSDSGPSADASRTIDVKMVDIAFRPTTLHVTKGDTVRFRFTNEGRVAHDAFVGDEGAQMDHEAEMADDMAGMSHDDGEDAITVKPGTTGTITHTFDEAGTTEIGCHQPGHYKGGMKVMVTVT